MAFRYYRYTTDATLVTQDVGRALGDMGGVIVRIDNRAGATEVTVAMSEDRRLAAESPLGAGVEVNEEDVLNLGR
jgi:secreted PhoX family phosphatase